MLVNTNEGDIGSRMIDCGSGKFEWTIEQVFRSVSGVRRLY